MRTQLAIVFLVAIVSTTYANPHLVRRQAEAPPAGEAAPAAPETAPAAPVPPPAGPAPSAPGAPAQPAPAAPAPPAPAPEGPTARQAPPRPPPGGAESPAGPSVFTLPDGAGLVVGSITGGFSCEGRIYGYYADVSNGCKIFHVCVPVLNEQGESTQPSLIFSFFCNNGTIFNQEALVCDYADSVDCTTAENYYSINEEFGKIPEGSATGRSAPAAAPAARPAAPAPAPAAAAPAPPAPAPAVPAPAPAAPAAATPAAA